MTTAQRAIAVLAVLAPLVTACGSDTTDPTVAVATDGASAPYEAELVESAEAAVQAMVKVEAWGAHVPPGRRGAKLHIRRGSGFFVDPDGIVLSAAHITNTATRVEVLTAGETEVVNAEQLGIAECQDLAALRIPEGPYPFLEWYDGPIESGLEIYAAGFPNGHPTFTLEPGEVVEEWPVGSLQWASFEASVQYTART